MAAYTKGEKVYVLHGPKLYKANILKVKETPDGWKYFLHYNGWGKKWDEWAGSERIQEINLKTTEIAKKLNKKVDDAKKIQKAGKKRKREEAVANEPEQEASAVNLRISLPSEFKKRLVQDWENINRNEKIMQLPVRPSINEIFDHYLTYVDSNNSNDKTTGKTAENTLKSLKIYFQHALPTMLLYRFERPAYASYDFDGNSPSSVYGAEHLLRLFVKMPQLANNTGLTELQKKSLEKEISGLCGYMNKKRTHCFTALYEKQGREYIERAKKR